MTLHEVSLEAAAIALWNDVRRDIDIPMPWEEAGLMADAYRHDVRVAIDAYHAKMKELAP